MDIITPAQCRAARALLNWSQPALSKRCKVHVQTISNFEHEKGTPTKTTLQRITRTLEKMGIIFLRNGGVDFSKNLLDIIEGGDCYIRLLDRALIDLEDVKNKELLIMFASDKVSPPAVNARYRVMRKSGIRMRQLIKDGDTYIMGGLEEYRTIPENYFTNIVTLVYGNHVAQVNGDETRIVIYNDIRLAERERKVFAYLWDTGKKPLQSIAEEKFE